MDQRVVLSRQSGTWSHIEAVVSQAFILRPLLFLIHISVHLKLKIQLPNCLQTILYFLQLCMTRKQASISLNEDLLKIYQ